MLRDRSFREPAATLVLTGDVVGAFSPAPGSSQEIWAILEPGGVFCNLEHVASTSARSHGKFLDAIGYRPEEEDPSNKLLDVETQLAWLGEIGFGHVDCYWK